MRKARIGVVCLTRKTYDYETAFSLYLSRCLEMEKDTSVQWKIYKENVIETRVPAEDRFVQDSWCLL